MKEAIYIFITIIFAFIMGRGSIAPIDEMQKPTLVFDGLIRYIQKGCEDKGLVLKISNIETSYSFKDECVKSTEATTTILSSVTIPYPEYSNKFSNYSFKLRGLCSAKGGTWRFNDYIGWCQVGVKVYQGNNFDPSNASSTELVKLVEIIDSKRCSKYADLLEENIPVKDKDFCTKYFTN